jgi:hypothetical protein
VSIGKGFIPLKTVEAFLGRLWRQEGLSGRKPWVHFPLRKTRVVFSILENQRRVSHMKTKERICWWHCDGIVLAMACGIPCASSGIPRHPLRDCHWIAPVIVMPMSAQPQLPGPTFFFLYFLSFLFFYIYS